MKHFLFWTLLCCLSSVSADYLDQQDLMTADKKCVLHYLTQTPKNLWSIEVDQNYCKDGAVQGFTTVFVKDALNRTVKTLQGFFHQGYWLSDFTGPIHEFYRSSSDDGIQDFIYKTGQESDLNLQFYLVARSISSEDKSYSVFNVCANTPVLLVAHEPTIDFKQSLFQTSLLRYAQDHLLQLCPNAKTFQILGLDTHLPPQTDRAVFTADIDLSTNATNISYRTVVDKNAIPKPTELRHEQGEKILSIKAYTPPVSTAKTNTKPTDDKNSVLIDPHPAVKDVQSATDLALTVRVMQTDVVGKVIVYVDHMNASRHAVVTKPYPLLLDTQTALAAGWYIVQGTFVPDGADIMVHVDSAESCFEEWCLHEK